MRNCSGTGALSLIMRMSSCRQLIQFLVRGMAGEVVCRTPIGCKNHDKQRIAIEWEVGSGIGSIQPMHREAAVFDAAVLLAQKIAQIEECFVESGCRGSGNRAFGRCAVKSRHAAQLQARIVIGVVRWRRSGHDLSSRRISSAMPDPAEAEFRFRAARDRLKRTGCPALSLPPLRCRWQFRRRCK